MRNTLFITTKNNFMRIAQTHPYFDKESMHLLGMGMGMKNTLPFQLGMEIGIKLYTFVPSPSTYLSSYAFQPYPHPCLNY